MDDISDLKELNLAEITNNLKVRFTNQMPYTMCGNICISVNPFQWLDLYNNRWPTKSHIFKIVNETRKNVNKQSQTIVISGESGAGKTELAKICMRHLEQLQSTKLSNDLVDKIILCNPVLEALGNASTTKNKNSSRFGKFIELSYNNSNQTGAKIITFLLEKSRVTSNKKEKESNYHIFYSLYNHQAHNILSKNNDVKFNWHDLQNVFETLGLHDTSIIQDTIQIILQITSSVDVQEIGKILQIDDIVSLTHETRSIPKNDQPDEVIHTELEPKTQQSIIKSLCMNLYSCMFEHTVNTLNEMLETENEFNKIGILDIFGFENFCKNCFEQFCINFTNEKLQEQFAYYAINLKRKEYMDEGINLNETYVENDMSCLDSCNTVITQLQEACRMNFSCNVMLQNLKNVNTTEHLLFPMGSESKCAFSIAHFADHVTYELDAFVQKNMDNLKWDVVEALKKSKSATIRTLFKNVSTHKKNTLLTNTIITRFKTRLLDLCNYMKDTHQHFVRCIKPNNEHSPLIFDAQLVQDQIKYSGFTQICNILRTDFPIRLHYGIYEHCISHLHDKHGMAFGKTRMFVSKSTYIELLRINAILLLQSKFRQQHARKLLLCKMRAIHTIQLFAIMKSSKKLFGKQLNATKTIQRRYRQHYTLLNAIKTIQRMYRQHYTHLKTRIIQKMYRQHYTQLKARIIQRTYRQYYTNTYKSKDSKKTPTYETFEKCTQTNDCDIEYELQSQKILLLRAKRLIQLYKNQVNDEYLSIRSDVLLKLL